MPMFPAVVAVLALLLAAEAASGSVDYLTVSGIVLAIWALVASLWYIAFYSGERPVAALLLLVLGPVYAGFLLGHGLAIHEIGSSIEGAENLGRNWLLFTLAGTAACDTGAYAVGRLIGRHQMAQAVSPNKTWEGAIGGFAIAVAAMLAVGAVPVFDLGVGLWEQAVVAVAVGAIGQVGDLVESALKRTANAKDSGSIMPGHGGLLDRIDSLLFALPAVYYLLALGFGL